jgi:competence protein ComEC
MRFMRIVAVVLLMVSAAAAAKTLDMYVIDVGGKASLFVSPSGETMVIDAGIPATVDRIVEACKALGVKKIDYMVVSHYDGDHVGGVPPLAARIPIVTFVDHGANVQMTPSTIKNVDAYMALTAKAKHLVVKAGDRIPIKGFDALVVMAGGRRSRNR